MEGSVLTSKGSTIATCLTNEPFVAGLADGKLMLQRCRNCQHWQYYPRPLCTSCGETDLEFAESSGRGTVYTFSRLHLAPTPYYKPFLPYIVALVDMEEGPRVMGHMADVPGLKIGDPVVFKAIALDEESPKIVGFEPAPGGSGHV